MNVLSAKAVITLLISVFGGPQVTTMPLEMGHHLVQPIQQALTDLGPTGILGPSTSPDGAALGPSTSPDGAALGPSTSPDGAALGPSTSPDGSTLGPSTSPDGAVLGPSTSPDGAA